MEVLNTIDSAVLLISGNSFDDFEIDLIKKFKELDIPFFIVHNKQDILPLDQDTKAKIRETTNAEILDFSTHSPENLDQVITVLKNTVPPTAYRKTTLFQNLVGKNDIILLVTPIDNEAPEGRLILPQVMAIRDILDHHAINIVLQETELKEFLQNSGIIPKMIVTDSQVFEKVSSIVPPEIPLTGFSILFARLKGDFEAYLKGTPKISTLRDGDWVLIMESCTHHVNCDDIGRFKIPKLLEKFTGKKLDFEVVSSFQQASLDIKEYAMVIQCGGCMFTPKQVFNRLKPATDNGIPVSNYGMAIAYMHGIFERATEIFK